MISMIIPLFAGCGSVNEEDVFSKTIHDFEGHHVVNLDEDIDDNFLVYAKETKQIQITENTNVLLAADEETQTYTFGNPDETLLSLEEGDVFFADATEQYPKGVAVKVKQMEVSEDTLIVQSEEIAVSDLFAHVDIDMDVPLSQMNYDASSLEEGMSIQQLASNQVSLPTAEQVTGTTAEVPDVSEQGSAAAGEETTPMEPEFEWSGSKATNIVLSDSMNIDLGNATGASGGLQGKMHYRHETKFVIKMIRVNILYDAETKYFRMDVSQDFDSGWAGSVDFEGAWSNGRGGMGVTWPSVSFFIPNTPIQVGVETFLLVELTGSLKGTFSQSSSYTLSSTTVIQNFQKAEPVVTCEPTGKSSDMKLELEGKAELSYGLRIDIGIPFVVDAFFEGAVGARAEGTLSLLGETDREECVHDCEHCLDGDFDVFARTAVGIDVRILAAIAQKDVVLRKELAEISIKVGDFYASYRGENKEPECGFGECPYLRWKTDVTVLSKDGEKVDGALVRAAYPDGREAEKLTDSDGIAVMYLPNGSNALSCSYRGERGSINVPIKDAPASATLQLTDERQIFVYYNLLNAKNLSGNLMEDFPELYDVIANKYPQAQWMDFVTWHGGNPETMNATTNYSLAYMQDAYGVSPGDLVLFIFTWDMFSDVGSCNSVRIAPGIALLPEQKEDAEAQAELQVNFVYDMVAHVNWKAHYDLDLHYSVVDTIWYECTEGICYGLEYDENYRIINPGALTYSQYKDTAPYIANSDDVWLATIFEPDILQYATRVVPYIDLLWEDRWAEGMEEQNAANAPVIDNQQNP